MVFKFKNIFNKHVEKDAHSLNTGEVRNSVIGSVIIPVDINPVSPDTANISPNKTVRAKHFNIG